MIVFVLRIAAIQFSVSADHIMSVNIQRIRLYGAVEEAPVARHVKRVSNPDLATFSVSKQYCKGKEVQLTTAVAMTFTKNTIYGPTNIYRVGQSDQN